MTENTLPRVAIVCGGRSAEHEVSLQSAQNIFGAIDRSRYEPILLGIDREGRWFWLDSQAPFNHPDDPKAIALGDNRRAVALVANGPDHELLDLTSHQSLGTVDVLYPILHGPYGEDGAIQGLARLANLPCVGADILGSAVGMDKDMMKRLLRDAGIAIADFVTLYHGQGDIDFDEIIRDLALPLFVKPANMGSSVGVNKASNREELQAAVEYAFGYDQKVIVEQAVLGREIEVAVLGNERPQASIAGEIIPQTAFYSYDSKYLDEGGADLQIPAELSPDQLATIQQCALETFRVLDCCGLARVDVFLCPDSSVVVNEINTLPGFTNISMYPKLWEHSGLDQPALVTRLIELAQQRFNYRASLKTHR